MENRDTILTQSPSLPAVSILIEWENVLLSAEDRCLRMLAELGRQLGGYDGACEVLVLHDPRRISETTLANIVQNHLLVEPARSDVSIRFVASEGMHYYELRNHGARQAQGEFIVCLDSDVVPEPGWLDALTRPLRENAAINLVAGETYLDHTASFFDACFALGWIFPMRSADTAVRPAEGRQFWANNMACRRSFFLRHPYPSMQNVTEARNACRRLKEQLEADGHVIWHAGGAKVSHPAPEGWRLALRHARVEGRDNAIMYADRGYGRVRRSLRSVEFARGRLRQAVRNSLASDCPVPMPRRRLPAMLLVLLPYYAVTVAGAWGQVTCPRCLYH